MSMIKVVLFFVISCIIQCVLSADDHNKHLLLANVLYRHGDRTTLNTFPNDPYGSKKFWPEGRGQLIDDGKRRQFELGKYLRNRYFDLLVDGKYLSDKVYIQSSDTDRSLASAAANLAGLFPAQGDQIWNPDLLWLPIPIHAIPKELDYIIATKRPCPRYDNAFKDELKSPAIMEYLIKAEKQIKIMQLEGCINDNSTIPEIFNVWDTLNTEKLLNKSLPAWAEEIIAPDTPMDIFMRESFKFFTTTTEMKKLKSGFLLREMIEHFNDKVTSKSDSARKLWIYSGHDTTIINLLKSLGLFEPRIPPYASCLLFELYEVENEFYVQLFFKNSTSEDVPPLNITGCGTLCPLQKFTQVFDEIIQKNDFETECQMPSAGKIWMWNNDLIVPIGCTLIVIISTIYGWKDNGLIA